MTTKKGPCITCGVTSGLMHSAVIDVEIAVMRFTLSFSHQDTGQKDSKLLDPTRQCLVKKKNYLYLLYIWIYSLFIGFRYVVDSSSAENCPLGNRHF